jgi:hypothetical protein
MDLNAGLHQVMLQADSRSKLAFYVPDGRKYWFIGMPFVPVNAPPVFISMMEDLYQYWKIMYKSLEAGQALGSYQVTAADCDLVKTAHLGTKVIVDAFLCMLTAFSLCSCYGAAVCKCLSATGPLSSSKRGCSMPDALEFVSVSLSREGNRQVRPATTSDLSYIKGLLSWYSLFIDWFEVRTTAWQKILSTQTDQKDVAIPPEMWTPECEALLVCIKEYF